MDTIPIELLNLISNYLSLQDKLAFRFTCSANFIAIPFIDIRIAKMNILINNLLIKEVPFVKWKKYHFGNSLNHSHFDQYLSLFKYYLFGSELARLGV